MYVAKRIIVKIIKEPRPYARPTKSPYARRSRLSHILFVRTSLIFCAYELHPQMYVSR
jgi:hypothetical protein